MALLDFLSGLGPVGGPRGLPMPIETIDPNMALMGQQGPSPQFLQAFAGGIGQPQQQAPAPQSPLAQFLQPDMDGIDFSQFGEAELSPQVPGMASQQPAPAQPAQPSGGFRDFLGKLGDVLLVANDLPAMYLPMKRERDQGEALAAFLGGDPGLASLARVSPELASQFYDRNREDKRFDRTAGQADRRIGVEEKDALTRRGGLYETSRHNQATEGLTERGQTLTAQTQTRLAELRMASENAEREARAALARGDQAHAEKMFALQQQFAIGMAQLEAQLAQMAGGGGTVTETAYTGYDDDGNPTGKRETTRKLPATVRVTDEAAYKALPSGAEFIGPDGKTYRKP
jgi:hypothetical protein